MRLSKQVCRVGLCLVVVWWLLGVGFVFELVLFSVLLAAVDESSVYFAKACFEVGLLARLLLRLEDVGRASHYWVLLAILGSGRHS